MLSWLVAAALTAGIGGVVVLLVEGSTALQQRYGEIGFGQALGVSLPLGERAVFYRDVLGAALSASEISLVQVAIIFLVLLLGLRVLLRWLGAVASSGEADLDTRVTRAFMQLAVVLLPALGILSTVVGILSTSHASREQVKLIIFGPTGIGVLGYLIANLFYFIADAADRKS